MARIAIIGGHGKIARLATPLLVADGHQVTALIRNPDHTEDVTEGGARALVADVEHMTTDEIAEALTGHDVVVWSAGAGGGSPERTRAVDHDAAVRSMDAAAAAGIDRYVMVSYFGAGPNHGVEKDNPFFAYAEAKAEADTHLRATDLTWTILMPSTLTDDPGTGTIDTAAEKASEVPRADVAAVVAAVLAADDSVTARRDIPFNTGDTPITEAITG